LIFVYPPIRSSRGRCPSPHIRSSRTRWVDHDLSSGGWTGSASPLAIGSLLATVGALRDAQPALPIFIGGRCAEPAPLGYGRSYRT
jgi:hypothetical protein